MLWQREGGIDMNLAKVAKVEETREGNHYPRFGYLSHHPNPNPCRAIQQP
jgi:hypothetical protein